MRHPENDLLRPPVVIGMGYEEDPKYWNLHRDLKRLVDTEERVAEWVFAPAKLKRYSGGITPKPDGTPDYHYKPGKRLMVRGEQVIDTCEAPWAQKTIDLTFKYAEGYNHELEGMPINVLEFGFGLGMTGNYVVSKLHGRGPGGEYRVVELNYDVYQNAVKWKRNRDEKLKDEREQGQEPPSVKIVTYHNEASLLTKYLVGRGKKFDIIISDTYPLSNEEKGINDLVNLPLIMHLLSKEGVFAFFPYVGGLSKEKQQEIYATQSRLLSPHFRKFNQDDVRVNPPPSYDYLKTSDRIMVRTLPIIICSHPHQLAYLE